MKFLIIAILALTQQIASAGYYPREATYNGDIGSQCEYDEDCLTLHAFCKNNRICECKRKYQYDQGSRSCYPTQLGLKCHTDDDCVMANSRCFEDVCQCRSGHVAAEPSADCLPSSRLEAKCIDDSQCRVSDENSVCNSMTQLCECMTSYHPSFDTRQCVPNKRLRDACQIHSECALVDEQQDKVECRLDGGINRCLCRSGFTEQNNKCTRDGDSGASSTTATFACILILTLLVTL